jgi:zona occludens toxin
MIYLSTGANGSGKTLITLWDVRQQQLREPHRQVFFNGFEALDPILKEFGWKPFEPSKWQDLPDNSICIWDEVQNELGTHLGKDLPDWVMAIAQFRRKRGFDFWMCTPHPMMLHTFVRRCIENPSWHRHMKRVFGQAVSRVGKFTFVNQECEKPGSFEKGTVSTVPFPKEVYAWYRSAEVHTAKREIPRAVWVLAASLIIVPVLGYYAYKNLMAKPAEVAAKFGGVPSSSQGGSSGRGAGGAAPVMTTAEYIDARRPRVDGLAYTAPAYDKVTEPQQAPYPAACVEGKLPGYDGSKGENCRCWTQQATVLEVPADVCHQIAHKGFFMDWKRPVEAVSVADRTQPVGQGQAQAGPQVIVLPDTGPVLEGKPAESVLIPPGQPHRPASGARG